MSREILRALFMVLPPGTLTAALRVYSPELNVLVERRPALSYAVVQSGWRAVFVGVHGDLAARRQPMKARSSGRWHLLRGDCERSILTGGIFVFLYAGQAGATIPPGSASGATRFRASIPVDLATAVK